MEAFTIASPRDLDAALAAARESDAKFIAGGTDLMQLMQDFVERPKRLVDIDGLPLDGVTIGADGVRVGALVRMADLADHAEIRRQYPVVTEALLASASPQVRNMATIGGNLLQRTRCGYFRDVGFTACNKRHPGSGCGAILGVNRLHAVLGGSDLCVATHASDLAVALAAGDRLQHVSQVRRAYCGGGPQHGGCLRLGAEQPGELGQSDGGLAGRRLGCRDLGGPPHGAVGDGKEDEHLVPGDDPVEAVPRQAGRYGAGSAGD